MPLTEEEITSPKDAVRMIARLKREMLSAVKKLDFERAADIRDKIAVLEKKELGI